MVFTMDVAETLTGNMSVNLGRDNIFMTQEFLDGS